ncbi:recombinase family protein [Nocardioides sp. CFH 31398]|uniref:recombinase family protein n=1 Tax=Nocardioides sp. CFH 31398 TaxID=2919579 RepID=UPI001F05A4AC|nr:recombinase family protein [Nocardioides sp. CFH 31398]MCH1867071.1 recombinase family protein [Nocardioides sp. CFH 31398]
MRAAIYLRQSLDKSGEGAAVDRQMAECRHLADGRGWSVGEVYRDNDASATKGPRPGWLRLLRDLDDGAYDVLICWHTDRLYRRLRDLADLLEVAERRKITIATVVAGGMDLTTPSGRFVASQMASVARYEVEQKGDRQVAANLDRARRGQVLWTRRPFGFDRDGSDVFIVEAEAEEIRRSARDALADKSLAQIAREMNERGVTTSLGGQWSTKTVKQVLLNPRVAGRAVYRGEDMGRGGPAILDDDTHERLVAKLTDPRRKNAPSTAVKHLLSGVALCGRDGCNREPMLFTTNGADRVPVYRCRRCYGARRRDAVDEVVMAVVAARLSAPDAARLFSTEVDVSGLSARANELRDRRHSLAAMFAEGLLPAESVKAQAKKLGGQIADLEREIAVATADSPLSEIIGADDVALRLSELPLLTVREVIKVLADVVILPAGKGVRFTPQQVKIEWKNVSPGEGY